MKTPARIFLAAALALVLLLAAENLFAPTFVDFEQDEGSGPMREPTIIESLSPLLCLGCIIFAILLFYMFRDMRRENQQLYAENRELQNQLRQK